MSNILKSLNGYARSSASQRESGDEFVNNLMSYAEEEYLNQTTKVRHSCRGHRYSYRAHTYIYIYKYIIVKSFI